MGVRFSMASADFREDDRHMRAWTVRGGENGEREQAALDEGLLILGWDELAEDLSFAASPADLSVLLRAAYPADGSRTIENWAYQLWQFVRVMKTGDLVVMPRKNKSVIAIGRVAGGYQYRLDALPELRHVRPVTWLKHNIERAALKGDLRDSMGSFRTVSELSRRDAAKRVQSLLEFGADSGYEGDVPPPAGLEELKADVDKDGTRQLSARDLIGLWGWQRRTTDCIDVVDRGLADLGLVAEPHFTAVQLDDLVTVSSAEEGESGPDGVALGGASMDASAKPAGDDDARTDLTWRIGSLSLVKKVVTVYAQQSVGVAIERMVAGEYSQLPVVDEYERLKGVITWESVAHAQFTRRPGLVADAMLTYHYTCRESEELFARIDDIQRRGFLVIVDGENVVTGILTATDLSGELRNRVQPFTVLEEIERRLRRAVSVLSVDELRASFPDGDSRAKKINSPHDLTLGSYSYVLDNETRWAKLRWPYERVDMVERIRKVAGYRYAIAHWDIDAPGQGSDELTHAKQVLRLLKVIDLDPA
jgi:restriction system protein